jgi:phytoene dehydrogenase-like protein
LRLAEHGLRIVHRPMSNFLPLDNGDALRVGPNLEDTVREVARFSQRDADVLPRYYAMLEVLADELRKWILKAPPDPNGGVIGIIDTLKAGLALRGLPLEAQRDLIELFGRSAGEMLDDWFETDALKAALGFDSIVGAFASPYAPGSAYVQLHHCFGEVNGKKGAWGHAIGGMGAITQAMARECERLGVTIRLNAKVARVTTRDGRACGLVLDGGEEISAPIVIANVGPKLLFNQLVDAADLPEAFRTRMQRFKTGSGVLRMNVALSELPDFCGLGTRQQTHHGAGIIMAPSLAYMHQAYEDARATGVSRAPVVEMLIPSTLDDTLAPSGQHVASLFCQSFAPQLPDGTGWDDARDYAADLVIDTVNRFAPNFKASVIARQVLTPLDLERTFGLTDGDIFHGRLSLEQLFASRPMLGYADYRTPLKGLYLCGSGAHPGGGVTGAPGHNAAQAILKDG